MIRDCFDDFVLVVGLARSGTSWLGKILDSDLRVLYRYEPFNVRQSKLFRPVSACFDRLGQDELCERLLENGFRRLFYSRNKHTIGNPPRFKKNFIDINLLPVTYLFPFLLKDAPLGWIFKKRRIRFVAKIVEFDWGLEWMSKALGYPKILFIIRHPCANVNSYLSGKRFGMGKRSSGEWARVWKAAHEKLVIPDNVIIPNFKLVVYEELCERPMEMVEDIYRFLGWKMETQTVGFVKKSVSSDSSSYWSVFKNPIKSANKWREELSKENIEEVYRVVGNSDIMRLWKE